MNKLNLIFPLVINSLYAVTQRVFSPWSSFATALVQLKQRKVVAMREMSGRVVLSVANTKGIVCGEEKAPQESWKPGFIPSPHTQ